MNDTQKLLAEAEEFARNSLAYHVGGYQVLQLARAFLLLREATTLKPISKKDRSEHLAFTVAEDKTVNYWGEPQDIPDWITATRHKCQILSVDALAEVCKPNAQEETE